MKIRNGKMKHGALAVAVQGALLAMVVMPVYAEDDEVAALKNPTNFVEVGAANVSKSSAKFGEYTGSNKSGAELIGNFSVRGGNAYGDSNGIRRWSITGSDLGLTSRALGATISDQGAWNLGFGYDELRHNITDSYQTPYVGSNGGNSFTLPAGFGVTANTKTGLTAAQLGAFRTMEIGSTRKNTSLSAGFNVTPELKVTFDFNQLAQSGSKLMAFSSDFRSGAGSAEKPAILPNPTNYTTNTVNLGLNWIGESGHATAAYYGSFFKDNYDSVTWTTFWGTNIANTMTTAPSNKFNQLNLSGGYTFTPSTKLAGGVSFGRNTQNSAFVDVGTGMMINPAPVNSLNGLVVTKHADLKLTNQTTKDLVLSAGYKLDERDNRTPSNFYDFQSLAGSANTAGHYPNTPFSNKKTQLELAGDYRLDSDQRIRLAYSREDVKRWCNQYGVDATRNYTAGTNCVVATDSKEDKLSANYKLKASEAVGVNMGYVYSNRKTTSDPLARVAMISTNGGVDANGVAYPVPFTYNPFAPNAAATNGLNGGDFIGYKPFFSASRKQQMIKAGANWQAAEQLSLSLSGRFTDDKYPDSTYGVQKGNSRSLNLDATYNYSENISFTPYVTQQHRERDMTSMQSAPAGLKTNAVNTPTAGMAAGATLVALTPGVASATAVNVPLGSTWSNKLKDDDITVGLNARQSGLLGGKLDLTGDLTYSRGKTSYATKQNYAGLTTGGLTCSAPTVGSCGTLPDFKNTMTQVKFTGQYKLDKQSKIALGYTFQKLKSDDWFYNIYQTGYTATSLMPTNQKSGSYVVNLVAATYIYNFR